MVVVWGRLLVFFCNLFFLLIGDIVVFLCCWYEIIKKKEKSNGKNVFIGLSFYKLGGKYIKKLIKVR